MSRKLFRRMVTPVAVSMMLAQPASYVRATEYLTGTVKPDKACKGPDGVYNYTLQEFCEGYSDCSWGKCKSSEERLGKIRKALNIEKSAQFGIAWGSTGDTACPFACFLVAPHGDVVGTREVVNGKEILSKVYLSPLEFATLKTLGDINVGETFHDVFLDQKEDGEAQGYRNVVDAHLANMRRNRERAKNNLKKIIKWLILMGIPVTTYTIYKIISSGNYGNDGLKSLEGYGKDWLEE